MKKTSPDGDYFLRFYLHSDPFPVTERDEVFFLPDTLRRRLDGTFRAVTGAGKVAVVTAAAGGGKSAFARNLAGRFEPPWSAAVVEAQAGCDTERFAAALVEDLVPAEIAGLPPVPRVYKFLESSDRSGTKPVILVDDAHLLADAALEFLLQMSMQRYNASHLAFVLLGEDTLLDRIEDFGIVPAEKLHVVSIPAFDRDGTREYIAHRLAACGLEQGNPVEDSEITRIHRVTGGLPGGIHCLAREVLIRQSRSGSARRGRQLPLILALLLAIGAGAYLYIRPMAPAPEPVTVAEVAPVPAPRPVTAAEPPAPNVHPPEAESLPVPDVSAPVQREEGSAVQAADADLSTDLPAVAPAESVTATAAVREMPAETPVLAAAPAADPVVAPDPPPAKAVPAVVAFESEAEAEAPAAVVATPAGSDDGFVPVSVDPAWREGLRGPEWIRQQPEGSYFLQLINASDLGNARRLLARLAGVGEALAAYTNYTPSGRPRYLLLYGVYPDRAAAEAAIADLPPEVRSIPPWPRARSGVLRDMENAEARGLAP